MPKRTTLLYTSADAPKTTDTPLLAYYCRYSGKHAFTTDVDIDSLPRRRTDGARILDTSEHLLKLYTSDGGAILLRRADGRIERQHRLNVGKLPVAYTSQPLAAPPAPPPPSAGSDDDGAPHGQLVYVLPDAVSAYGREAGAVERVPVPPCIRRGESGSTEMVLEIEDRQPHAAVAKITADAVRLHITSSATSEAAQQELAALLARTLNVRLTQLTLVRGAEPRRRTAIVEILSPAQAYLRLKGVPEPKPRTDDAGRRKRPWFAGL